MPRTYLEKFEQVVLLIAAILDGEAYGVTVRQQTGRKVTFVTVHNTLIRLEEKGLVKSGLAGATYQRRSRRNQLFTLTPASSRAIQNIGELRSGFWQPVSSHSVKLAGL